MKFKAKASAVPKETKASAVPKVTEVEVFVASPEVIISKVLTSNLGTSFGFQNYYFLTLLIALAVLGQLATVYLNTGYSVILINRVFFKEIAPIVKVSLITTTITVYSIGSNRYFTNKYVLLPIFFPGKRNGKDVVAKIVREVYLIDDLKAKILINTDIISPEKIDIITSKGKVFIGSYKITVDIDYKPRSRGIIRSLIVVQEDTIVPPRRQISIPIHYTGLLVDRDFLFKPTVSPVSLFI